MIRSSSGVFGPIQTTLSASITSGGGAKKSEVRHSNAVAGLSVVRVSEALKRQGLSISPAGVRCVWQRHDLTSIEHRLKALEAKVAQDGILCH